MANKGAVVTGIDFSFESIEIARKLSLTKLYHTDFK